MANIKSFHDLTADEKELPALVACAGGCGSYLDPSTAPVARIERGSNTGIYELLRFCPTCRASKLPRRAETKAAK